MRYGEPMPEAGLSDLRQVGRLTHLIRSQTVDDVRRAWDYLDAPGRSVAGFIDQREALRHGWADVAVARDDALLLDYAAESMASLAADSAAAARDALARLPRRDLLVVHLRNADDPDGVLAAAEDAWAMHAYLPCSQVAYFGDTVPVPERPDLRLEQLDATWTDVVASHYSLGLGTDYARQRLAAGVVLGAFLDDAEPGPVTFPGAPSATASSPTASPLTTPLPTTLSRMTPPHPAGHRAGTLVGFIGSHEEGSMGMLEVFPQYRRRGIGEYLTLAYASRLLAKGRVPWSQVIAGNDASLAMQLKWGFTVAPERIAWLHPAATGEMPARAEEAHAA